MASVNWSLKSSELELHTKRAPISRKSCAWCSDRTTLTSGISSARQIRSRICPRFDAAALWTIAVWPSLRAVSTIPNAVRGLTKLEAACAAVMPRGRTRHSAADIQRWRAYMSPAIAATVRPIRDCAAWELPAATTVPAPSSPTAVEASLRDRIAFNDAAGTGATSSGPPTPSAVHA